MRGNKYHAVRVILDGINFDSIKESERYSYLKLLEATGDIHGLEMQKEYILVPEEKDNMGKRMRPMRYYADFYYIDSYGSVHVEDVKGMQTAVYKLKKRLLWHLFHIAVEEV